MRLSRWFLLTILALMLMATPVAAESDAPYLYYYSEYLNAWVIERADGTESRTLAAGVMPKVDGRSSWGSWSSSGKWFAWRGGEYNGPAFMLTGGWIIRSDGSQRITILDDIHIVLSLSWSPVDDVLMMLYVPAGEEKPKLELLDVERQTILATATIESVDYESYHGTGQQFWSANGKSVSLGFRRFEPESQWFSFVTRTVSIDGNIVDTVVAQVEVLPEPRYVMSPDFRQARVSDFTLYDSVIDQSHVYSVGDGLVQNISWDADEQTALVWVTVDCVNPGGANSCVDIWFLDHSTHSFNRVVEGIDSMYGLSATGQYMCGATINQSGFRLNIQTGVVDSIGQLDPVYVGGCSPNGQMFWAGRGPDLLTLVDFSQPEPTPVDISLTHLSDRHRIHWSSLRDWSPSGRYVGLGDMNAIVDLQDYEAIVYPLPPFLMGVSRHRMRYQWTPDESWMLVDMTVFWAGGGGGPRFNYVTRLDGQNWRELAFGFNNAEWLPEQVIPHLAVGAGTSVLPAPENGPIADHDELYCAYFEC